MWMLLCKEDPVDIVSVSVSDGNNAPYDYRHADRHQCLHPHNHHRQ